MPETPPFRDDLPAGLVASEAAGDNAPALSITELSALLKRTVEDRFGFVRVRGELSGVKRAASGHLYLSLKDENARLDGVMWRGGAQRLGFQPEDGIEVVATGKLTTYSGRSNYQIVIERMEIAGEGALLALLAKTKARLEAEGLFAPSAKRPLPYLPTVIGVVTSPTGAVIRDILHRLRDRFPTHVVVWPVLVQGPGAAAQIASAVRGFSALAPSDAMPRPDLVMVVRGGGSIEDLWCFNDEDVVRAIAGSTIPVISAVGHETDTTLADFAADMRAPTPTAAAEMAVPVRGELAAGLADLHARQQRAVVRLVSLARERLEQRARRQPPAQALLDGHAQRLDDLGDRLRRALGHRTGLAAALLATRSAGLRPAVLLARHAQGCDRLITQRFRPALVLQQIGAMRGQVDALDRVRRSLDPEAPLARGYVLVMGGDGHLIRSRAAAAGLATLSLKFADGELPVVPTSGPVSVAGPRMRRVAAADTQPKLL